MVSDALRQIRTPRFHPSSRRRRRKTHPDTSSHPSLHRTFLLSVILLILHSECILASAAFFPTSARTSTSVDDCGQHGTLPTVSACTTTALPLSDGRAALSNAQCRTLCESFSHLHIDVTLNRTSCAFCSSNKTAPYVHRDLNSYSKICVPRSKCIEQCGTEPPGCVYTGSCKTLTCFKDSRSGEPAEFARVTHSGWRSLLSVENQLDAASEKGDSDETAATEGAVGGVPPILDSQFGNDLCVGMKRNYSLATTNCGDVPAETCSNSPSKTGPFGSGEPESGQCRAYCATFNNTEVEVVRKETGCDACNGPKGEEFANTEFGLCIPRADCVQECGLEWEGCVYTGSCRSQLCFSGIDTRRPAVFRNVVHGGPGSVVAVDNKGGSIGADVPAYGDPPVSPKAIAGPGTEGTKAPPKVEGDVNEGDTPPKQEADTGGTPSEETNNTAASETEDTGEKITPWVWLGPLCGLLGTVLAAGAAIVAAFIMRGRARAEMTHDLLASQQDFAESGS